MAKQLAHNTDFALVGGQCNHKHYAKGLMYEFDNCKTNYQRNAGHNISWLRDDETSIEKTINNK